MGTSFRGELSQERFGLNFPMLEFILISPPCFQPNCSFGDDYRDDVG